MQDLNATSIENQAANRPASSRLLPFLMLLFFGSGFAALIYEIVWLQLLELVIGSSGISLGVLLGTFMGGMCLGSLVLPRLISNRFHPLRVYAVLELGIGLIGILVVFGMPHMADLYARLYWHGVFARTFIAAVCLIPPTLLMGATLPAVARFVESTPEGVSWMGFFYGGNIAGAVAGCLIAGFFLLRIFDMPSATFIAAAINALVAAIALMLSRKSPHKPVSTNSSERARPASLRTLVLIAIALSGMSALGAEVVWTRLLSLLLGATVYSFSIILTVFLVGLGDRKRRRFSAVPDVHQTASCTGRLSIPACGRRCLGCVDYCQVSSLLARKSKLSIPMISVPGTSSSSTCCGPPGWCCPPRFSGAPVFPWRSRPLPRATRTRDAWWAESTRQTPSAPSWVHSRSVCGLSRDLELSGRNGCWC